MCGICGKLELRNDAEADKRTLERMMSAINHRGPDGRGSYVDGQVALGHTRLAIIDLHTGAQPMCNEDETIWVVFNGEIYNFGTLRDELAKKGHIFKSATDTEVIVHLYEEHGADCLKFLQGMFAFAIWDKKENSLLLARDRVGIKPLYYTRTASSLLFASEIKALLGDPEVQCEIHLQSVDTFLTHYCLPGRETLWKNIYKLEPGHYLSVKGGKVSISQYWDLAFCLDGNYRDFGEAEEALFELIKNTVASHMISDVPVGFLLSGGVDSTVILSCAARKAGQKLHTFTVGFDNASFEDERPYARLASREYGSEHHEISITPDEFWSFLPTLSWHMEEPICDPPAVSLYYISKLARNYVKVLLSGEGGDEAFGGYHTYRNFMLVERIKRGIHPFEKLMSQSLRAAGSLKSLKRVSRFAPYFDTDLSKYYYSRAASPFTYFNQNKAKLYSGQFQKEISDRGPLLTVDNLFRNVRHEPVLNQMQYIDTKTSLPDDLLVKADRMTMANSLELRVPFLDHRVLEFAASLPPSFRVRRFKTKRILKHAFRDRVPREILRRRKVGFPIPIESWMRNEFSARVRDVLFDSRGLCKQLFSESEISRLLDYRSGKGSSKDTFSLLTLQYLHSQFAEKRAMSG
jgi:asparagine synthase (glutamine-hydrolysing)